ncbi:MAG TPA: HlyD family efflux transporter periplasmic adaptor subunit, partial [Thiotrichaceae bacterium]|nr:HlyD family efflux transporter periplasmic adaptor subunit [Thiotrichaceae bacterium]
RIEANDYKVLLNQTKADLIASKAQLVQIQQEQRSTQNSLKLANNNLRLGLAELKRVRSIWNRRLIARSVLDAEEQKVNQLRLSVQDIEGKLSTYSSRIRSANANINRSQQQVKGKQVTLGRTEVRMPFDARISAVSVEKGQFTAVGGALFEAINTDGVEVKADIPLLQMRALLSSLNGKSLNLHANNFNAAIKSLNLKASVALVSGDDKTTWRARVVRFSESIDPLRRTLAVTVAVDAPYQGVVIGKRPPLLKGMYVAVTLTAPPYKAIVIPRSAVHLGRAYVINKKGQLAIRKLDIKSQQGEEVVISKGLKSGDQLIINDLMPIIIGMPLKANIKKH